MPDNFITNVDNRSCVHLTARTQCFLHDKDKVLSRTANLREVPESTNNVPEYAT